MKTKDLIQQLQNLVDNWSASGAQEMMGEHEVSIDVFKPITYESGNTQYRAYAGISPNLEITYTADGVYCVISAKETWL